MTRRDRLRDELLAQVREVARSQLRDGGLAGVSMRAIARDVGMAPASLYNYFDGVDDVITDVIADSYRRLGAQVADATSGRGTAASKLRRGMVAYRSWAWEHPEEFRLLYGSPLVGYAAPAGGPTVDAALTVTGPLIEVLFAGWTSGEFVEPPTGPRLATPRLAEVQEVCPDMTAAQFWAALDVWSHVHGLVVLELNGHFMPGVDYGAFFESRLDLAIAALTGQA